MPVNYKIIGNRIKCKRKSRKITQKQMAEHLDVTPGYISQIERGTTKINFDLMYSISEILECDMTEFLERNNVSSGNIFDDEILGEIQKLSPSERRMLSSLISCYIENVERI